MFTTEITTIAGQPMTITQPVCKQRRFFVTGHTKSTYEIHSRTVAQWELQIGEYKEVMEIVHQTNAAEHIGREIEQPFVSLSTSTDFEPLIHLGNKVVAHDARVVRLFKNMTYFNLMFGGIAKAISEILNNGVSIDSKELMNLTMLMREVYEYVVKNMVVTDLSGTKINCEASHTQSPPLISKSLDELIDNEIIWAVYHPDEIGTKGGRDHLRVEQILNEHRAVISNDLYTAESGVLSNIKHLEELKIKLDDLNQKIENCTVGSVPSVDLLSVKKVTYQEEITKAKADLAQSEVIFAHTKERLATNTKARLHAGVGGMQV